MPERMFCEFGSKVLGAAGRVVRNAADEDVALRDNILILFPTVTTFLKFITRVPLGCEAAA